MGEPILVKDLPLGLVNSIGSSVGFSTVAFLRAVTRRGKREPQLVGSGVLVSAAGVRAIVTADHVLDVIGEQQRIGLFLTPGNVMVTIDASGVAFVRLRRGDIESNGPDLAAVVLGPPIAGAIAASKTFYNLDLKRAAVLAARPPVSDGVWIAQGFLEERTEVRHDDGELDVALYNFSGVGGPDEITELDDHDYVDFHVSYEARATAPLSWGGMSGGGLWQVGLRREGQDLAHDRPILAGVLFYQHPTSDTEGGVRGHAWRSVYSVLYREIINHKP